MVSLGEKWQMEWALGSPRWVSGILSMSHLFFKHVRSSLLCLGPSVRGHSLKNDYDSVSSQ